MPFGSCAILVIAKRQRVEAGGSATSAKTSPLPVLVYRGPGHPAPDPVPLHHAPSATRTTLESMIATVSPWQRHRVRRHAASRNRRLRGSSLARPNIERFSIFNRLMCPSTGRYSRAASYRLSRHHSRRAALWPSAAGVPHRSRRRAIQVSTPSARRSRTTAAKS